MYLGAGAGGWVFGAPQSALLVLGPPRSGKTSSVVVPNLLAASGPVLATSTKLDVCRSTSRAKAEVGRTWLFDPAGSVAPPAGVSRLRWSPVAGSSSWPGALLVARTLVAAARPAGGHQDDSHWSERAGALLAPVLRAAALRGLGMQSVCSGIERQEVEGALAVLQAGGEEIAADALFSVMATEDRERSAIFSTASSVLRAYQNPDALAQAESPNFDPRAFVTSHDTIYLAAPAHVQELVAPIAASFVDGICQAAYEKAVSLPGGSLDPPLLLALDEVANIAPLPRLPALVSEGGGQGISVLACLQDLSQARRRWGSAADGFFSLFGTKMILPGIGDRATLELVSLLGGEADVVVRSVHGSGRALGGTGGVHRGGRRAVPGDALRGRPGSTPQASLTSRRERRLPPDRVAQGVPGMALVVEGALPPHYVGLTPAHLDPFWRAMSRSDIARGQPTRHLAR